MRATRSLRTRLGGGRRWLLAAALAALAVLEVGGAPVTERRTLTLPGGTVVYYVTLPNGYNSARAYPMLQCFHGWTHTENNTRNITRLFCYDPTPIATNVITACIWYEEGSWIYPHWSNPNAFIATKAVMNQIRSDHLIDPQRIFALGFSQGGNAIEHYVWGNVYTPAELTWAGLIYCSGVFEGEYSLDDPDVPKSMPVFIEYGDTSAGEYAQMPGYAQSFRNALLAAGYTDVEMHQIPGQGHYISEYYSGLDPNACGLIGAWWGRVMDSIGPPPSNQPPTITAVTIAPTNRPMVGQTLTFSVATGGGTPTSRLWTFGDGATASGSPVTHAYATLGAKTVSVTVSNAYGQATSNTTVTVVDTAQATLNSIADAYVQSDNPTANLNWESLITDGYRDHSPARGTTRDILIKFDLSPIPAGAAVTQARLRVYCSQDQNYASRCATLYVKRVLQDWVEGEVTWQNRTAGASWAGSAFAPGEGSNYDAAPAGFIEKHVGINWLGTVQDIDVTPLAQGWIGLGQANNGLVIQTYAAIGTTNILGPKRTDFSSRETANPPQLVVSYSMGGGSNAPPRILGLASVAGNTMRMSFEGVSGQVYRLFYTTGLVPTNWIPLGAVTSQGGTVSIDDAGAGAATQRYYRVSEQ